MTRPARRVPLIPTLVVALAVAAMIGLGLWQLLDRLPMKERYLADLAGNPAKPPVTFPRAPDDRLLFRRSAAECAAPSGQTLAGAGAAGYRVIVRCAGGALVQLGTTRDPRYRTRWPGGLVAGVISHAPSDRSLIGTLLDHRPQPMLLVADTPPPGLVANDRPGLGSVPNNHLSYAVQWFFFAAVASIIYLLALRGRRRERPVAPAPDRR